MRSKYDCQELRPECGNLCSRDNITHLMTRLALIEGSILEHLEKETFMNIREVMEELEWEPCAVSMAIGSLIRQGLIRCREANGSVFLDLLHQGELI